MHGYSAPQFGQDENEDENGDLMLDLWRSTTFSTQTIFEETRFLSIFAIILFILMIIFSSFSSYT